MQIEIKPEVHRTRSAGGVVVDRDGKVLVVSQMSKHGVSWSLPKGHVEAGEDDLEAAKREIHEETGIGISRLEFVRKLGEYERPRIGWSGGDDLAEMKTIALFLFKTDEDPAAALTPLDPENPQAVWLEKGQVAERLTHEKDKEFFRGVLETGALADGMLAAGILEKL